MEQPVTSLRAGPAEGGAGRLVCTRTPDVLLLDEPTRGIDIGSKAVVYQDLSRNVLKEGKAVLRISSYLPELFGMCDRLAVMAVGALSGARADKRMTPESVMQAAIGSEEKRFRGGLLPAVGS